MQGRILKADMLPVLPSIAPQTRNSIHCHTSVAGTRKDAAGRHEGLHSAILTWFRFTYLENGTAPSGLGPHTTMNNQDNRRDTPTGQPGLGNHSLETPSQIILGCVKLTVKANHGTQLGLEF